MCQVQRPRHSSQYIAADLDRVLSPIECECCDSWYDVFLEFFLDESLNFCRILLSGHTVHGALQRNYLVTLNGNPYPQTGGLR